MNVLHKVWAQLCFLILQLYQRLSDRNSRSFTKQPLARSITKLRIIRNSILLPQHALSSQNSQNTSSPAAAASTHRLIELPKRPSSSFSWPSQRSVPSNLCFVRFLSVRRSRSLDHQLRPCCSDRCASLSSSYTSMRWRTLDSVSWICSVRKGRVRGIKLPHVAFLAFCLCSPMGLASVCAHFLRYESRDAKVSKL